MFDLKNYFGLHRAIEKIRKKAIADYWEAENKDDIIAHLSQRQLLHLMMIHERGTCTLQDVMNMTGLSASAASTAVDKLVKSGILHRKTDETNRRFICIRVTEELLEHMTKIDLLFRRKVQFVLKNCNEQDIEALERVSGQILEQISELPLNELNHSLEK